MHTNTGELTFYNGSVACLPQPSVTFVSACFSWSATASDSNRSCMCIEKMDSHSSRRYVRCFHGCLRRLVLSRRVASRRILLIERFRRHARHSPILQGCLPRITCVTISPRATLRASSIGARNHHRNLGCLRLMLRSVYVL